MDSFEKNGYNEYKKYMWYIFKFLNETNIYIFLIKFLIKFQVILI